MIADDMGLGKSLTILSAIASSLDDAADFVSTQRSGLKETSDTPVPSKATLIMVPSTSNYAH